MALGLAGRGRRPGRGPELLAPAGAGNRLGRILREGEGSTAQTYVRWAMVLLLLLLVIAQEFGLDVVLGAFLAGVVLRRWAPGDVHALESKLDAIGYGFFIPRSSWPRA